MNTLLNTPALAALIDRAFAILADNAIKGLVLMILAWVITASMRRSSAAARCMVWSLAFGGLLLLPALSLALPKWQLPILPQSVAPSARLVVPASAGIPDKGADFEPRTSLIGIPPEVGTTNKASYQSDLIATSKPAPPPPLPQGFWFVAVWLVFFALFLVPLVAGLALVRRIVRGARAFDQPPWPMLIEALASQMRLRRRVRVLKSSGPTMPMAVGIFRPAIILLAETDSWAEEKRHVVLLHELAHVRRWDCLTHILTRLACVLHWFNPLAWMALRKLQNERERACDDLALEAGARPLNYAHQLLEIARTMQAGAATATAAIPMASKTQLEGRLLAILDTARNRCVPTRRRIIMFAAAFLIILMCFSTVAVSSKGMQDTNPLPAAPDLSAIVSALRACEAKIQTAEVESEFSILISDNAPSKTPQPYAHTTERFADHFQKRFIDSRTHSTTPDGKDILFHDGWATIGGKEYTYNFTYGGGHVTASSGRDLPHYFFINRLGYAAFTTGYESLYLKSISEMLLTGRNVAVSFERDPVLGEEAIKVEFIIDMFSNEPGERERGYKIWLLPKRDYLPVRIEVYYHGGTFLFLQQDITEFMTVGSVVIPRAGIWKMWGLNPSNTKIVPEPRFDPGHSQNEVLRMRYEGQGKYITGWDNRNSHLCVTEWRITKATINEPIPDSAFALQFPANAQIYREPSNSKKTVNYISRPDPATINASAEAAIQKHDRVLRLTGPVESVIFMSLGTKGNSERIYHVSGKKGAALVTFDLNTGTIATIRKVDLAAPSSKAPNRSNDARAPISQAHIREGEALIRKNFKPDIAHLVYQIENIQFLPAESAGSQAVYLVKGWGVARVTVDLAQRLLTKIDGTSAGVEISITSGTLLRKYDSWNHPALHLRLQAKNLGEIPLVLNMKVLAEVDGQWYEWLDPVLFHEKISGTLIGFTTRYSSLGGDFKPGTVKSDLDILIADNWRRILSNNESEAVFRRFLNATYPVEQYVKDYGERLVFKPGKHTVRLAIVINNVWIPIRIDTNPITVNVSENAALQNPTMIK